MYIMSSLKLLEHFHQVSHGPSVERVFTVCLKGSVQLKKMTAMPICGKNALKSSSLEPRKL